MEQRKDSERLALLRKRAAQAAAESEERRLLAPYLRAQNEDDDGYDPYSDRPASPEPLFERNPWD